MSNFEIAKNSIEANFEMVYDNLFSADGAFDTNSADLRELHRSGKLTDDEYHSLRCYNRTIYSELPLNL